MSPNQKKLLIFGILWGLITPVYGAETPQPEKAYFLAEEAIQSENYDAAIPHLLLALDSKTFAQAPDTFRLLGLAYFKLELYGLAADALGQYQALNPKPLTLEYLYYLAISLYEIKDFERAQPVLKAVLEHPKLNPEAQVQIKQRLITANDNYLSGYNAFNQQQYSEAIAYFERMPADLKNTPAIQTYLGSSYYSLRDYQQAKFHFVEAQSLATPESVYAETAKTYLQTISLLLQNQPLKPFEFTVTLGSFGDSNLNLGGSLNNLSSQGDSIDSTLSDLGANLNLRARYQLSHELQSSYQLNINQYTGLWDEARINSLQLESQQYNRVQQALDMSGRYSLAKNQVFTFLAQTRWDIFGGNTFNYAGLIQPAFTFYLNDRLITRFNLGLTGELYPEFQEWTNANYQLGIDQYIYLWNTKTWLRFYFYHRNYHALDTQRNNIFEQNNQIFEQESRRAFSRSSQQLGLNFQFPIWIPTVEIGTYFNFVDYTESEIFNLYQIILNPITGLPLPRIPIETANGYRRDTLLQFFIDFEWPFSEQFKLNATYTRTTNLSNIHPSILNIGDRNYNYLRDLLELHLQYVF